MLIHVLHIEDLKFSDIAGMLEDFWDPETAITWFRRLQMKWDHAHRMHLIIHS